MMSTTKKTKATKATENAIPLKVVKIGAKQNLS